METDQLLKVIKMAKFVQKAKKSDVIEAYGFDWFKIVKVDGGFMLFSDANDYKLWKNQK